PAVAGMEHSCRQLVRHERDDPVPSVSFFFYGSGHVRVLHSFPTRRSSDLVRYFGTPDQDAALDIEAKHVVHLPAATLINPTGDLDRKSTRLNSSHLGISYAVFCLKKKSADSPRGATSAFPWVCRLLRLKSR